jgi:2-hydroxychromene-2-carboxylate isomerase
VHQARVAVGQTREKSGIEFPFIALLHECGFEALHYIIAALNDPAIKALVKTEVDKAIARGAFGSPYVVIDDEAFWGADRLAQVEQWLASGGWKY